MATPPHDANTPVTSRFCPKCGCRVTEDRCPGCGPAVPTDAPPPAPRPTGKVWRFIGNALIVLFVVLAGALVLTPRSMYGVSRKAREETLKSSLHYLRRALNQFHADTHVWPAQLGDIVAPADSTPTGTKPGLYKGPYLTPNGGV